MSSLYKLESLQMAAISTGPIIVGIPQRLSCFTIGVRRAKNAGLERSGLAKGHLSAHHTTLFSVLKPKQVGNVFIYHTMAIITKFSPISPIICTNWASAVWLQTATL
jgi:hypothetical protein